MPDSFPERSPEPSRRTFRPPSTPGLNYIFCPVGQVPPPEVTEIWDCRRGRWVRLQGVIITPIRPADSLVLPYGWYRQPKNP